MCGGVHSTRPSEGAELQGRGPRRCTVREQGPQQSTVRGRRSLWWGPQHPSVGGGAELQERGPRKCTVKEQGPQQSTVRGRRSVWWGPQHPSVGGGGRSYRGEARGIRPGLETQVCKVTMGCGYRCGRDRVSHVLKFRGRVISAIRYSVGARVYLPVIPSIMIRAPRMVAVRRPGGEWSEGRVLLP